MQRDDIQKLGAQAARESLSLLDCPYLRASGMPGHCGGSIAEWREKLEAWEAGWCQEVRSRPSADRSLGRSQLSRLTQKSADSPRLGLTYDKTQPRRPLIYRTRPDSISS